MSSLDNAFTILNTQAICVIQAPVESGSYSQVTKSVSKKVLESVRLWIASALFSVVCGLVECMHYAAASAACVGPGKTSGNVQ